LNNRKKGLGVRVPSDVFHWLKRGFAIFFNNKGVRVSDWKVKERERERENSPERELPIEREGELGRWEIPIERERESELRWWQWEVPIERERETTLGWWMNEWRTRTIGRVWLWTVRVNFGRWWEVYDWEWLWTVRGMDNIVLWMRFTLEKGIR